MAPKSYSMTAFRVAHRVTRVGGKYLTFYKEDGAIIKAVKLLF
jgi:hypothetical protein